MRTARLLAALLTFLAVGARADTLGNRSLVTGTQDLTVDDTRTAVAYEFVAERSGSINLASLWLKTSGATRSYTLGLREADPATGAPKSAWLGNPLTRTIASLAAPGWHERAIGASLTAGASYFLVLETAGSGNTATLVVSTPAIDAIPFSGASTSRAVWAKTASGWSELAGVEPIFMLRYNLPDTEVCGPSNFVVMGNPYSSAGSVLLSTSSYPVSQTLELAENYEITRFAVALDNPAGASVSMVVLDRNGGEVFYSLLRRGTAPWYYADAGTAPLLLRADASPFTVQLTSPSGAEVHWITSKAARIVENDACDRPLRAGFGAKNHLSFEKTFSTEHRYDEDGTLELTGCKAIYTFFRDFDKDGFGDPEQSKTTCAAPQGYVENSQDCDDRKSSVRPGATELCDGVDNDCNGQPDDVAAANVEPCVEQRGVCAGSRMRCGGAQGWINCSVADYGVLFEAFEATCDGLDNNCDGETDNIDEARRPACDKTEGVCAGATAACSGTSGWAACDASRYGPDFQEVEDRCDGRDNDCDGVTDEVFAPESCSLQSGVCQGAVKRCVSGTVVDCTDVDYAAHSADFEPEYETRCDGLDNDCDGRVDDYTPTAEQLCPNQKGVCAGSPRPCDAQGMSECADTTYASHSTAWQAEETTCDGLDNDCDGEVDEMPPEALDTCLEQRGLCAGTRRICVDGMLAGCDELWLSRNLNGYESRESSCDGVDNDCDGVTDPEEICSPKAPDAGAGTSGAPEDIGCGCGGAGAPWLPLALLPLGLLRRRRN